MTTNMTIYTLDWLEKEANLITGHWNGSDERFVDGSGELRTEDDENVAEEFLERIAQVRDLAKQLGL